MNPKKPVAEKAKNAGISLEPDLIQEANAFAKDNGYRSISGLTRFLLKRALKESAEAFKNSGDLDLKKASQVDAAKKKSPRKRRDK